MGKKEAVMMIINVDSDHSNGATIPIRGNLFQAKHLLLFFFVFCIYCEFVCLFVFNSIVVVVAVVVIDFKYIDVFCRICSMYLYILLAHT